MFNTKKIKLIDANYTLGCESCDYGSSDEITILIEGAEV